MESKDFDHPDLFAASQRDRDVLARNIKCHYAGKPNLHVEGSCVKAIRSVRWISHKPPRERLLCASCIQYFVPDIAQLWVDWVKDNIEKDRADAEDAPRGTASVAASAQESVRGRSPSVSWGQPPRSVSDVLPSPSRHRSLRRASSGRGRSIPPARSRRGSPSPPPQRACLRARPDRSRSSPHEVDRNRDKVVSASPLNLESIVNRPPEVGLPLGLVH